MSETIFLPTESKKYTILYVDDEPDLLDLIKMFLERDGSLRVETYLSVKEAWQKLTTNTPLYDLILSDYQMPQTNGLEFLQQLKSAHIDLPFIIFTGKSREEIVIEALNSGVNYYVQKGGDFRIISTELNNLIKQAIRQRYEHLENLRFTRLYAVLSQISQIIVHATNVNQLYMDICNIAINYGKFLMAWIGNINEDQASITLQFHAGIESSYLDMVKHTINEIMTENNILIQGLLETKCIVFGNTVYTDQNVLPLVKEAKLLRYNSVALIPISFHGKVSTVLAVYAEEKNFFDRKELDLLLEITKDISFSLAVLDETNRRKLAEEKIRYQESILDEISDAIITFTPDNKIIGWNKVAEQMYGWKETEVLGKTADEVFKPQTLHQYTREQILRQIFDIGFFKSESIHTRKDGVKIHVLASAALVRTTAGVPFRIVVVYRDLTAYKDITTRLQFQANLLNTVSDAIIAYDMEWNILSWNDAAEKLYGWKINEVLNRSVFEVLHPHYLTGSQEQADIALKETGQWRGELIQVAKNGKYHHIMASKSVIKDKFGTVVGHVGVNHDITELLEREHTITNLNRIYRVLSYTNQSIVRIKDRNELFKEICHITVRDALFLMAWIGVLDIETGVIIPVAYADTENENYRIKQGSSIKEGQLEGNGFIRESIRTKTITLFIVPETESLEKIGNEYETKFIYKSAAAVPFQFHNTTTGVFVVYAAEKDLFGEAVLHLLTEMASDISFALGTKYH